MVGLIMAHKNADKEGGHRLQDPQEVNTMAPQKWGTHALPTSNETV